MHAELKLGYGITAGHNAGAMLMRGAGLAGLSGKRARWRLIRPPDTPADLVDRNFVRHGPDRLWFTEMSQSTQPRNQRCAARSSSTPFSRRVVGWSIDQLATSGLVTSALGMAICNREPDSGTVIHSDHRTHLTCWAFGDRARESGLVPSMGSVGDCFDCEESGGSLGRV